MKQIETTIDINASPKQVWNVFTDFEGHEKWNPFIKSFDGEIKEGNQIEVTMQPPGMNPMTMKPKILVFDRNKEFRWKGRLLIPGLFDGEHYFKLKENDDGTTTFIHGEKFSGILVGLFGGILKKTEEGFKLMNVALKTLCESGVGSN